MVSYESRWGTCWAKPHSPKPRGKMLIFLRKCRERLANHSRLTREYFTDRICFQHKPNNCRRCILTENSGFLIVRGQFRYAAALFVSFLFGWWNFFLWVYAEVYYESWFYSWCGTCQVKPRGVVLVFSTQGFRTSHGGALRGQNCAAGRSFLE